MRLACCLLAAIAVFAQEDAPTVSQVEALERFASERTARETMNRVVDTIASREAKATFRVVEYTDGDRRARGLRIDLESAGQPERLYIPEDLIDRLIGALDEIEDGANAFFNSRVGSSACFGSGAFLLALREGAHVFHASQCNRNDGWSGVQVSTGRGMHRFGGLTTGVFSEAVKKAAELLRRSESPA
jgi:hypothetical protein